MTPLILQNNSIDELEYQYTEEIEQKLELKELCPSQLWYSMQNTKSMIWVIIGGRGSGKTWDIVWNLVEKARVEKLIKIIAGRLKADKLKWIRGEFLAVIRFLNCEDEFDMNNQRFLHKETGCEIHFMAVLDEDEVRGLQGVKYFYVDESKDISKEMVETIIPSVRMEGGEVYFAFNPEYESDYLYREYVLNWSLKEEEEKTEFIKKMTGEYANKFEYNLWSRVEIKNIKDVILEEKIYSETLGKTVQLLPNTLRNQFYAGLATAQSKNNPDAWANFRHIWFGECNYSSTGLVYYNKVVEFRKLPEHIKITSQKYEDHAGNIRTKFYLNNQPLQLFIGADWGETRSATAIIIAFEHEQEIQSPSGGIFYKYDFYAIKEIYLTGAECKDVMLNGENFGFSLAHKIYDVIVNHEDPLCREIYHSKYLINGDSAPRSVNFGLQGLKFNVEDVMKTHESVARGQFVDDNIDRFNQRYDKIYINSSECPNLIREIRSFRSDLVVKVDGDKGEGKAERVYYGERHCLDAMRYSAQKILYRKKQKMYVSEEILQQRKQRLNYKPVKRTPWQTSVKNIKYNTKGYL